MICIDSNSSKPIYEQIYNQIVKLIVTKVLKPNEKLPSVRELASTVMINPNTIQKAYKLLEKDNYIYSKKGKGNFITDDDKISKIYLQNLHKELRNIILALKKIEVSDKNILTMVNNIMKGDDKVVGS